MVLKKKMNHNKRKTWALTPAVLTKRFYCYQCKNELIPYYEKCGQVHLSHNVQQCEWSLTFGECTNCVLSTLIRHCKLTLERINKKHY